VLLILSTLKEKFLKPKRISRFAVVVTPKRNHSAMALTAKLDSKPNNSLWADYSSEPLLTGDFNSSYDVAIIGGGFSGLWSAYHLLELNPELSIAIFEAKRCGFGASGRNGGWASSDYPVYRKTLEKRHGKAKTDELFKALTNSIDEIGIIAKKLAPGANFVKSGTLMFARNSAQESRLKDGQDELHIWKDKKELEELIQVSNARGGLFNSECATINPIGLVDGLKKYLLSQGVTISEGVFATPSESGVFANSSFVRASVVIQATEVFGYPEREFIPLYSQMVATDPLTDSQWQEIGVVSRFTFAEASHLINYAQRTADNRLAIGGRGATYPFKSTLLVQKEMTSSVHENLRNLARSWFPNLKETKFTHAWGGAVAITRNWEPYVQFDNARGFGRLGGYAGDGVTMSFLASKILAQLVTGRESELTHLHFVNKKIRKWEPEPLRYLAVNSMVKLSGIADKEEARTGRPSLVSRIIAPLILR
jgi:glycine/D-amino acid oxidase-like deaminating enzyme